MTFFNSRIGPERIIPIRGMMWYGCRWIPMALIKTYRRLEHRLRNRGATPSRSTTTTTAVTTFISARHVKTTKPRAFTLSSSITFRCRRKIPTQAISLQIPEE
jgi:hypothetical protein